VDRRFEEYLEANDCVNEITLPYYVIPARNFLNPNIPPAKDVGVVALLEECGWTEEEPIDFAIQWNWIDYEWVARDISTREYPYDAYELPIYMITDPRGFEYLPQRYAEENGVCMDATKGSDAGCPEGIVRFDQRVTEIVYDLNPGMDMLPKVMVTATNSDGSCTAYTGKRAVVAVSAGVINQDKIKFTPPLLYSATNSGDNPDSNPIKQRQFVKLFFQFPKQFWPKDREFMFTLKENELRENPEQFGECQQWQILDTEVNIVKEGSVPELLPGSKTLMCVLSTESFERLIDPETGTIPKKVVYKRLLDRLRRTFRGYVVRCALFLRLEAIH
jgi:Flavin containing amine oxidoreductase